MFCTNCGKEISEGLKFCSECGINLKTGKMPTREKPVPPTQPKAQISRIPSEKKTGRNIAIIIIALVIIFIIIVPITVFFIIPYGTYGKYEESFDYNYTPPSPSALESIDINLDIGRTIIKYNQTPTPHVAKIDMDFSLEGPDVGDKTYTDYFKPISWVNDSAPITFTLEVKPDAWASPFAWFTFQQNITATITLRTDVVYAIDATTTTGSVELTVPSGIAIGDLDLQTTTGSISMFGNGANFTKGVNVETTTGSNILNFTNCIFGGNVVGDVTTGSIEFLTYNSMYSQNSQLSLSTTTGSVSIEIYQYSDLGADVTGQVTTSTGGIDVIYEDNQGSVGALFTGTTTTGSIDYNNIGGFTEFGGIFESNDYSTATYKYTFTMGATTGSIDVDGKSS